MLIIAEKPDTGNDIALALGKVVNRNNNFIEIERPEGNSVTVTWAYGHLLRLKYPEEYNEKYAQWNIDNLPLEYPPLSDPQYVPLNDSDKKTLELLGALLDKSDEVVHAGDIDPEGQLIVDSILHYLNNDKPVKRLMLNSFEESDIVAAFNKMEDNKTFKGLTESALARTGSDMLYGFSLTQFYTLMAQREGLDSVLSVGRVQTPTLNLVIQRYLENKNFIKTEYYDLQGIVGNDPESFVVKLSEFKKNEEDNFELYESIKFLKETDINSVIDSLKNKPLTVVSVDSKPGKSNPPLPFNISTLQSEASKKFKYKPKKVMEITQALREKYKVITYNRTDCRYIPESIFENSPNIISAVKENFGERYLQNEFNLSIKSRAFDNSKISAHHGIIPTAKIVDINQMSVEERNIYQMISDRFCIQFMEPERSVTTKANFIVDGWGFSASSKVVTSPGYTAFDKQPLTKKNNDNDKVDLSKILKVNDELGVVFIKNKGKTSPPALYTQASLVSDLTRVAKYVEDPMIKQALIDKDKDKEDEHGSIGTGATRHTIIESLIHERGFLQELANDDLVPTEKGLSFVSYLPDELLKPDMTALWHVAMQEIESEGKSLDSFMEDLNSFLVNHIEGVKKSGVKLNIKGVKTFDCPNNECSGKIVKRKVKDKGTYFWACTEFKNGCKSVFQDVNDSPQMKDYVCPACNNHSLRYFDGKYGKTWNCQGYKDESCNASFPDKRGEPSLKVYDCPNCKINTLKRIKGKNSWFWGCSGFKKDGCESSFQDYKGQPLLIKQECPNCKDGELKYIKPKGKDGFWGCSNYSKEESCQSIYYDDRGKPLILKKYNCPKCEEGELKQIRSDGKKFWGCSAYEEGCDAVFSDYENSPILEKHKCPNCESGEMRLLLGTKGYFWSCNKYKELGCKTVAMNDKGKPKF